MPIDAQVPSWLQPPSEAEQRRLKLIEDQVQSKAGSMLRKQIGVTRMKQQAQEAIANGVDESTARKNALLNNAELLFGDNPEALARLQHNEDALAIRERTLDQTKAWHEQEIARDRRELDAKVSNWNALHDLTAARDADRVALATDRNEIRLIGAENSLLRTGIAQAKEDRLSAAGPKLSQVEEGELRDIHEEIGLLNKARIALDPTMDNYDDRRMELLGQVDTLNRKARKIGQSSTKGQPNKPTRLKWLDGQLMPVE